MVNFSSVASSLLNVITGESKADSKSDGKASDTSFLTLLNTNTANISATETDQSLVDTLYKKDDDIEPPAVPMETNVNVYHDDAPHLLSLSQTKEAPKQDNQEPDNDAPRVDAAPAKKETPEKNTKAESRSDYETATKPVKEATAQDDNTDFMKKIRGRINDLMDLMSMLASMMGGGQQVTSVTMIQITKTSSLSQQLGLDTNGNFTDLSDRFNQLIGAIEASQNLPGNTKQTLTITIASFQSILTPQSVNDTSALSVDAQNAFLNACSDCETGLKTISASLLSATTDTASPEADISQMLSKMGDWLKDFRNLMAQAKNPKLLDTALQATSVEQVNVTAPAKDILLPLPAAKEALPAIPLLPTQTVNADNNAIATAANNVAVVAGSNAASGNNTSSNNGSGQGGDRPATAPVAAAPAGGASAATASNAPSFAKTLNAATASRTPVAEQVTFHIKTMVKDGSSKIDIQLDPESLGKVSIKLEVGHDGKTGVIVTADHKSTLDLLQRDSRGLEQALADAGLKTDSGSLSFNLRGGDQGKGEQQQQLAGYTKLQPEEEEVVPLAALTRSYAIQVTDGLDIKI